MAGAAAAAASRRRRALCGTFAPLASALLLLRCAGAARLVPRLIHQTVADKGNMSCEAAANVARWKALNPGHTHRLWDDAEARAFVAERYPALLPVPYDAYLSGVERADVFRVLVLHALGGVYADIDVAPLRPVDDWPLDDVRAALGVEYYGPQNDNPKLINWVMAAAPQNKLFGAMPAMFTAAAARDFFVAARNATTLNAEVYRAGIVGRTGPNLVSEAADAYFQRRGRSLASLTRAEVDGEPGVRVGSVRVLPHEAWGLGAATLHGGTSCEALGKLHPRALVCHQYWGTWKSTGLKAKQRTYPPCKA
jgi:hypothetical protein